jgi:tripeptide aminopeptidase
MSILDIFLKIVKIDSESFNEDQMSIFIQNFLSERGFEFKVDHLNQVYTRIEGSGGLGKESIIFCAHIDTVSPGKGINPVIHEDGKVTSDGTTILGADNKASVASLLWLIDRIGQNKPESMHTLEIVFTVQEEVSPSGARQLDFDWFKGKAGFVFDKGSESVDCIVVEAGFINDLHVEFDGVGAHASSPQLGKNALLVLNEFLNHLSGKIGTPYPESTLNFGLIEGGDAINTVPGFIRLSGDYRSKTQHIMKQIMQDIENAKSSTLSKINGVDIRIYEDVYCMGYSHDLNSDRYSRLKKVYTGEGFQVIKEVRTQSSSDASAFNNSGRDMEVFCLGSGVYLAHTVDEYTTVGDLERLCSMINAISTRY